MKEILGEFSILLGAYLIGSLPTGYVLARFRGIDDITQRGSGNIGATNVSRTLGIPYFFLVLLLDASKAFLYLCVLQYYQIPIRTQIFSGVLLLIGNGVSLFLRGRGGKGISTSIGIVCAFKPLLFPIMLIIWFFALCLTQTVGIASIVGLLLFPLITVILGGLQQPLFLLSIFISLWGIARHSQNIKNFLFIRSEGK